MTQPGTGAVVWCGRRVLSCGGLLQVWDLKACNTGVGPESLQHATHHLEDRPHRRHKPLARSVLSAVLPEHCLRLARLLLLVCVLGGASCLALLLPTPQDIRAVRAARRRRLPSAV
jgi:hypothetical protein